MRMRKKKNLGPRMERWEASLIEEPSALAGRWRERMPEAREVRVELGCGKGRFTAETASKEPDVLFIAVELVPEAIVVAMERCGALGLANVLFIRGNVDRLPLYFQHGEVDRIYINFCDPWPSKRHAKRRLTHGDFLQLYRQVLKPGGQIHFKTDNAGLFDFSLEEFPKFGFTLSEVTRDLHANGPVGVMTDYEAKFHAMGQPIHRLVGTMDPSWTPPEPDLSTYLEAQILEVQDFSLLVRDRKAGHEVIVHTPRAGEFQPGDFVRVRTDRTMTLSLPPQVTAMEVVKIY